MRLIAAALIASLLVPLGARADEPLPPPPPVPAPAELTPPPPPPSSDAPQADLPPPPPVPSPYYAPGQPQTGYPYSPAAPTPPLQKPGPEVGLIVSESLFGLLTAAGMTLLPYLLLGQGIVRGALGMDPALGYVLIGVLFATLPLAVSQTIVSIANGSRYYVSESWPSLLSGLGVQAAVMFIYFLAIPKTNVDWAVQNGGTGTLHWSEWLLMFGSMIAVPAVEILVLNLTKQSRFATGAALRYRPGSGLVAGVPAPVPLVGTVLGRSQAGVFVPLVSGAF